ncbi:hypothetical protein GCM10022252_24260 [Streptosporangium oxazolinicum]|uniref:Uncharacterized protein n=1 Tax=Streptosporangium oxazolinicum TaxID=909287 RepID=A0ABP8ARS9_9ACTN
MPSSEDRMWQVIEDAWATGRNALRTPPNEITAGQNIEMWTWSMWLAVLPPRLDIIFQPAPVRTS